MRGFFISVLVCAGCVEAGVTTNAAPAYELRAVPGFRSALGHDHRPRFRVFRGGEPIAGLHEVVSGQVSGDAFVVVDVEGRLLRVDGGTMQTLGEQVVGEPAIDGEHIAWVGREESLRLNTGGEATAETRSAAETQVNERLVVHRHTGGETTGIDTGLFVLGALRFVDEGGTLIGIGAANGGMAGFVRIDDEVTCLSNCDLRAGGILDAFVPASSDFRVEGGRLEWRAEGRTHSLRWAP